MTQDTLKTLIHEHFGELDDPRVERTRAHHLLDIIAIALLAVLSGAEGWVAMETYGKAKQEWLSRFLELPNGIPSHDTFARVLARIDPQALEQRFQSWIDRLVSSLGGEVVA
ncbi:MAG: ISAs1 family transposase, partial [Cyanobacteria bacterium J06639_1]